MPAVSKYIQKYECWCLPNSGTSIFTTKHPFTFTFSNRKIVQFNVLLDYKIFKKIYLQSGGTFYSTYTVIDTKGDSIRTYKGEWINEFTYTDRTKFFEIPVSIEYRLNKYFYPVVGVGSTIFENRKGEYITKQLEDKSFSEKGVKFTFAGSKMIGLNFMIPKTNRVYFTFKAIYRKNDWKFKKEYTWYSFGLKIFVK